MAIEECVEGDCYNRSTNWSRDPGEDHHQAFDGLHISAERGWHPFGVPPAADDDGEGGDCYS